MLALLSALALGAAPPPPAEQDRQLIAEAQAMVRAQGDAVWPGFSQAPLPVLLIGPAQETLLCGLPQPGFAAIGFDPITRCTMQTRPRQLPEDLAASADLGSAQVIQMGLPAALGLSPDEWSVTFLHEAFHQYQSTLPGYTRAVDRVRGHLGQSGGQWMLDYPFPYADPRIKTAFAGMTASALRFLEAKSDAQAVAAIRDYVAARTAAQQAAGAEHWPYYEFQAGQEGVARWSEIRLAALVGAERPAIAAIGAETSAGLAVSLRAIDTQGVAVWRRSVFYVLGAVEAAMLDRVRPQWQQDYIVEPFAFGAMLSASVPSAE